MRQLRDSTGITMKNPVPFPIHPVTHVVWIQPGMEKLLELPWDQDTSGWAMYEPNTFKYTRSRWTYYITYNCNPVVIKRYLVYRALRSYVSWFWPSKAEREFKITQVLYQQGLPVSKPLGCLTLSKSVRLLASYLITEFYDESHSIYEYISQDPDRARDTTLFLKIGSTIGQLHAKGVAHEDCSAHNFLVRNHPQNAFPEVLAIDLDGSTLHHHIHTNQRTKNLIQLARSFTRHQMNPPNDSWLAFREGYLNHTDTSYRKDAEQAIQSMMKLLNR